MAPRRTTPAQPERPIYSVEQKQVYVNRLKKRIAELEAFDPATVEKRHNDPNVLALQAAISDALSAAFGHGTREYNQYSGATRLDNGPITMRVDSALIRARHGGGYGHHDDSREAQQYVAQGKEKALALLKQAVRTLEEEIEEAQQFPSIGNDPSQSRNAQPTQKHAYHLHVSGDNPRVNINSLDTSENTVNNQSCDFSALAGELAQLRAVLLQRASAPEHYAAIGAIASAEMETQSGDSSKVSRALSAVGTAGAWVLNTAKEIGVPVATELLRRQVIP